MEVVYSLFMGITASCLSVWEILWNRELSLQMQVLQEIPLVRIVISRCARMDRQ